MSASSTPTRTALPTLAPAHLGTALALTAATAFGTGGVIGVSAMQHGVALVPLLSSRYTLAAVVLWAIVLLTRRQLPARRDALLVLALGGGFLALQSTLFFTAMQHIPVGLASLFLFIYPTLVTVGAVVLRRERADARRGIALLVASGGIVLVLVGSGAGAIDPIGVAFALAAALVYATYLLIAEGILSRLDPVMLATLLTSGAAISYTVAGAGGIGGGLDFDLGGPAWLLVALFAVFATVLPIAAVTSAVGLSGASTTSIVGTWEVPMTAVMGALVLGQQPMAIQAAGGVLVICAVLVLRLPVPRPAIAGMRALRRRLRRRTARLGPERRPPAPAPERTLPARRPATRGHGRTRAWARSRS